MSIDGIGRRPRIVPGLPAPVPAAPSTNQVLPTSPAPFESVGPAPSPQVTRAPLPTMALGEGVDAARLGALLGPGLDDVAGSLDPKLAKAVNKALDLYEVNEKRMLAADKEALRSHLADLVKVFAKLDGWRPAISVFGTARSSPKKDGSAWDPVYRPLYQRTVRLGEVIARLQQAARSGAGPGAMEGVMDGYVAARAKMARNRLQPFPPDVTPDPITGISPYADLTTLKTQGVKINLNPKEMTFEQNVSPLIEDPVVSENFLARKVGLWLNAMMTVVAEGGFGTMEEMLEVLAQKEIGFLDDELAVIPKDYYGPIIEAFRQHSLMPASSLDAMKVLDSEKDLVDVFRAKAQVGFEKPGPQVFLSLATDLIKGMADVSPLPSAVTFFGADSFPAGDGSAQRLEEVARRLAEAGTPLRTAGAQAVTEAVAAGVRAASGEVKEIQVFSLKGRDPEGIEGLSVDHRFETFIVQKELLNHLPGGIVIGAPDTQSLSMLFSVLTLIQTKEIPPTKIVLLGSERWTPIWETVCKPMLEKKTISVDDPHLVVIEDDPAKAAKLIQDDLDAKKAATTVDGYKKAAAIKATEQVLALEKKGEPYTLGLGTGSTTKHLVDELGRLKAAGKLSNLAACVSTSVKTTEQARALGLSVVELADLGGKKLTLAIDGADEIAPDFNLIKGGGGAMLREKAVELEAKRLVIIADESKLSKRLGTQFSLPVEVEPAFLEAELLALAALGSEPTWRKEKDGKPFVTDNGNHVLDCDFRPGGIADATALAKALEARPHVKAHGLFLGMADEVIIAGADGVRTLRK